MAGGYLMENICNDVKAGLAYGDIAVLCPQKRQTQQFFDCLTRHKIPAYWLVKDAASKKDYDASRDRVLISTVHSAKGRGSTFPLDYLNERENASMIYVVMTRAKKTAHHSKRQPDPHVRPHKRNSGQVLRGLRLSARWRPTRGKAKQCSL
jgi:superfamily I DNA/RNA helicase